jgi:tRNA A58 N-methylase Trm61
MIEGLKGVHEMEFVIPEKNTQANQQSNLLDLIKIPIENDLKKRHVSSEIDLALGFNIKKIEEKLRTEALNIKLGTLFDEWGPILHNGAQTWVGLDFQILQCSYHDLKTLFETIKLKPHQTVVDLGAGYGRIGIFMHWFYRHSPFIGIELVKERVDEANRIYKKLGTQNKTMLVDDLSTIEELPEGEIYFIYDFGSEAHLKRILNMLKEKTGKILIVKGRICHNLIVRDPTWEEGFKLKKFEDIYLYYL